MTYQRLKRKVANRFIEELAKKNNLPPAILKNVLDPTADSRIDHIFQVANALDLKVKIRLVPMRKRK